MRLHQLPCRETGRGCLLGGGLPVDEILSFAAAINAAGDVDLRGVDGQALIGVVETSVASAVFMGLRPPAPEPLKITSAISLPRRLLADCSPRTHLIPSTMLLLPEPFGPTTTVIPEETRARPIGEALEAVKFERFEHCSR